jgi:cytochrome c551/c552
MLPIPGLLSVPATLVAAASLVRARRSPRRYRTAFLAALALTAAAAAALFTPLAAMGARERIALLCAVVCALPALRWIRLELGDAAPGARRRHIIGACALALMFLLVGHHLDGDGASAGSDAAAPNADAATLARGEAIYARSCLACHARETRLIGPPLTEIARLYANDPSAIARWAKAPGRKRPDFPPMPPVALPDEDLAAAGAYMVMVGHR